MKTAKTNFARANKRKKTSENFERYKKNARISKLGEEFPRGETRSTKWTALHRAWIGYKIANNPKNGESIFDRMYYAQLIQDIQSELGIGRASFPQLGLLGDITFLYDKVKELELQNDHDELKFKEYKKKKKEHIKTIVDSSMMTDDEKNWMYDGVIPKYAERLIMVDHHSTLT